MNNALNVAWIGFGASCLAALIAIINALITSQLTKRSTKEIEALKFEFSTALSREKLKDEYLTKALVSLQGAIQAIQFLKDEIQLTLSAPDGSLDADVAIKRLETARQRMLESYESQCAELDKSECDKFHKAKNMAITIVNLVGNGLGTDGSLAKISDGTRQSLNSIRNQLTEIQNQLRDSRANRIIMRIGNVHQSE
jgi:hypothetical protein